MKKGTGFSPNIQPYMHRSPARMMNEKPSPWYYGPFQIAKKISGVAYKLELPWVHESIQCSMPHY